MKKVFFSLLAALLLFVSWQPKDVSAPESVASAFLAPPSHQAWDQLLQAHVSPQGKVDYQGFAKEKARLEAYLATLSTATPQSSWSRTEQMAYWINAYNAFTVHLIVTHYPVKSIRDIEQPWDQKNITLGGKTYSLNDIEHKMLRAQFKDARIHFAVNCASISCPPLLNRAYTATQLDQQLDQQTRAFLSDAQYNQISSNEAKLSKIFEWYQEDFIQNRTLIAYLNAYSTVRIADDASVSYLPYDWNLNGK